MAGIEFASRAPTLITAPLFVVWMLFVSVVLGRRLLQLLGADQLATPGERLVIATASSFGLLQFVPFALGVLGVLSATWLRVVLALLGVAALIDLPPLAAAARRWWSGRRRLARWEWAWLGLLALPLVFSFFAALAPSFDPDGLGYHLTAPKRWLEIGSLDFLPTLTYTNGPMGTEMLYAVALSVVGDAGAKLLHFVSGLLAAGGLYLFGSRVGGRMVGRIACTLFLFGPFGVYGLLGAGMVEGTASLAIVASTLSWVLWFRSASRGWLAAAALLAGMAVTFKLTSVLFPVALLALTILVVRLRGRSATGMAKLGAARGLGLLALVVVPMVPWLARSLVVTGNPVFPLLAQWIPSRDFPADMSREFETYNRYMLWANRWGYDLSIDARRAILGGVALLVLAIGTVVYVRQKDPLHRVVTLVIVPTVLVQVVAAGLYTRYWIPLAAVILVPIIAVVVPRISPRLLPAGLLVGTVLLAVGEIRSGFANEPGELVAASVDDGRREQVLRDRVPLSPLYRAASEDAGPGAAVLMTYVCGGFYVDGPSLCTEFLQNSVRLSDWEDFNADLEELGVTHVIAPTVLADGGPRPYDGNGAGSVGFLARDGTYTMVSRLLRERGELLASADDQSVYRIAPTPAD